MFSPTSSTARVRSASSSTGGTKRSGSARRSDAQLNALMRYCARHDTLGAAVGRGAAVSPASSRGGGPLLSASAEGFVPRPPSTTASSTLASPFRGAASSGVTPRRAPVRGHSLLLPANGGEEDDPLSLFARSSRPAAAAPSAAAAVQFPPNPVLASHQPQHPFRSFRFASPAEALRALGNATFSLDDGGDGDDDDDDDRDASGEGLSSAVASPIARVGAPALSPSKLAAVGAGMGRGGQQHNSNEPLATVMNYLLGMTSPPRSTPRGHRTTNGGGRGRAGGASDDEDDGVPARRGDSAMACGGSEGSGAVDGGSVTPRRRAGGSSLCAAVPSATMGGEQWPLRSPPKGCELSMVAQRRLRRQQEQQQGQGQGGVLSLLPPLLASSSAVVTTPPTVALSSSFADASTGAAALSPPPPHTHVPSQLIAGRSYYYGLYNRSSAEQQIDRLVTEAINRDRQEGGRLYSPPTSGTSRKRAKRV